MQIKKTDITSHFIGIKLKATMFNSLYADIKNYLRDNNLETMISLSDQNSLHITLYYLSKVLTSIEMENVQKSIDIIRQNISSKSIHIDELKFFTKNSLDILAYLSTKEDQIIMPLNKMLQAVFTRNDISDNLLDYLPHCTLFTIRTKDNYLEHKTALIELIDKHLKLIRNKNTYETVCLFQVNSKFIPEIQVPLLELG